MELLLIAIVILIASVILHEVMHGYVADLLGDPTARLAGRLTLNPLPHIDPLFSVLIPALLIFSGSPVIFGAAKPVPINPIHFKDFKKDIALSALAGPATNIVLAIIAALIYNIFPINNYLITISLLQIVKINLALAILNLLPVPPIDGSKVLIAFLPTNLANAYLSLQQYGLIILMLLLFMPIGIGSLINSLLVVALRLLGIP